MSPFQCKLFFCNAAFFLLQPANRGSSAQPLTRVQRFGASILHYLHDKLKTGKKEMLESVIR